MKLHRVSIVAVALIISACASSAVTSDVDSDGARIALTGGNVVLADAEATRACASQQKAPTRVGYSCLDSFCTRKEMVYACR